MVKIFAKEHLTVTLDENPELERFLVKQGYHEVAVPESVAEMVEALEPAEVEAPAVEVTEETPKKRSSKKASKV